MSLQPGTRLGPYEVVAQIGSGGMGEVYRAQQHGGAYSSGELLVFNDGKAVCWQTVRSR